MDILFKIRTSFLKILIVDFFALTMGVAIVASLGNLNFFIILICIICIASFCFIVAGEMYKEILFYKEKIVIKKPLLNSVTTVLYNDVQFITIEHVYQEGAQVIVWFKHRHNGIENIRFDYQKKNQENLLRIFKEAGLNVSNEFQ